MCWKRFRTTPDARRTDVAKKKAKSAVKKSASKSTSSPRKKATKKKRGSGKRELIDTGRDKRYVRRDGEGQFRESDDVGRSLSLDRRRKAKKKVKAGYGDKGDR